MPPKRKAHAVGAEAAPSPPLTETVAVRRCVGAHVSASGGGFKAVENARAQLGPLARCFAFFVRPRLTFRPMPPLPTQAVDKFHEALAQSPFALTNVVVHGSYLINLGSHNGSLRARSIELMVEEVDKCAQLGIGLYVFHAGAATGEPSKKRAHAKPIATGGRSKRGRGAASVVAHDEVKAGSEDANEDEKDSEESDDDGHDRRRASIAFVAQCVVEVLRRTSSTTLVLENSCGHGNALARDFGELRALLDAIAHAAGVASSLGPQRIDAATRLGVCLDTCHAFTSGYAMHSADACEEMMAAFDDAMGPTWLARNVLKVVHVNDSKDPLGSRRDRHENIGRGHIGMPAFQWLMTSERFVDLPLILETPRHEKKKSKKPKTTRRKAAVEEEDDEQREEIDVLSAEDEIALLLGLCAE